MSPARGTRRGAATPPSDPVRVGALIDSLAEPLRREVVQALVRGPRSPGELARELGVSAPALSRHLRVLREHGLLRESIRGDDARVRDLSLAPEALAPLRDWLDALQRQWQDQLDAFAVHAARRARKPR
jgi:DNA-binding transcriptional ArsR family regulator